ncbi:hypothetical protein DFJ74DRAFT_685019 [Hyaloraphidium curvatum]|nr:hypothetical protein DFJ74DRAFT_685019 [Hyaloraphidium curvatum]
MGGSARASWRPWWRLLPSTEVAFLRGAVFARSQKGWLDGSDAEQSKEKDEEAPRPLVGGPLEDHALAGIVKFRMLADLGRGANAGSDPDRADESSPDVLRTHVPGDNWCSCPRSSCTGGLARRAISLNFAGRGALPLAVPGAPGQFRQRRDRAHDRDGLPCSRCN